VTGTHLTGATALNTGNNISVQSFTVVNDTTITATVVIASGAGVGPHNFTVTTPGGTTNPVTFTVQAPRLTSISPNAGARGTSVNVTLTGTGLTGATALNTGNNIAVQNFTVVSSTTITATVVIANTAGVGIHNFTVTAPGGTTNPAAFTVQ
jgi:predicted hotdog family 3-hydroxylacyl-ACP dehydratase